MPQSNLFYYSSGEQIGMMELCAFGGFILQVDGHVSVCLTRFSVVLAAYVCILLRLGFVRLNISAGLCRHDMTGEEEVPESPCVDPIHLISIFSFQALWNSLQNIRYTVLV